MTDTDTQTATLTGTLRCSRLARYRRGRSLFTNMLLDRIDPLPTSDVWMITVSAPAANPRGELMYQQRSRRLPGCLRVDQEDQQVTVRAQITPWSNGLGGYIARVRAA